MNNKIKFAKIPKLIKSFGINPNPKPNRNPLDNQLWCIDFLTPSTPLIIPHRLPAFLESLMPLKNWCTIHARWSKSSLKHYIRFCDIFPSLKQNFIAYRSSKVSDCIFEIHQQWQSGFSRLYSNSYCSCSFEPEIIKIGLSSHKMYSNSILYFEESTIIVNASTKKVWKLIEGTTFTHTHTHTHIYIYIYIYCNSLWNGHRFRKKTKRLEFKSQKLLCAFHNALILLWRYTSNYYDGIRINISMQKWVNNMAVFSLSPWYGNRSRKTLNSNLLNLLKHWPCVASCS